MDASALYFAFKPILDAKYGVRPNFKNGARVNAPHGKQVDHVSILKQLVSDIERMFGKKSKREILDEILRQI